MNFLANTKITRGLAAEGANTTSLQTVVVDMKEFDTVIFIASLGDVTASSELELVAQQGDLLNGSDAADLEDATVSITAGASNADDMILAVEVSRPTKRYLRAKLVRAAQNAVLDDIIIIQSNPKIAPTTHDAATVLLTAFGLSPDEE